MYNSFGLSMQHVTATGHKGREFSSTAATRDSQQDFPGSPAFRGEPVLRLQKTIANHAVLRRLGGSIPARQTSAHLQRKCECSGSESGCACQTNLDEGVVQRKNVGAPAAGGAPSIVSQVLRSPGQPLDAGTRDFFESRFGHDFRDVRVHTDYRANESARAVHALAYTVGRDIVFRDGQYMPATMAGRRLLAHELTHAIQQRGTAAEGPLRLGEPGDRCESEADAMASQVLETAQRGSSDSSGPLEIGSGDNPLEYEAERNATSPTTISALGTAAVQCVQRACPTAPAATPGNCDARHDGYVAGRKCFPLNPWLPCVDRASAEVCRAIAAFSFRGAEGTQLETCVLLTGGDTALTRAKGAWFDLANSCIWGHWRAALDALNDSSVPKPSGLTAEWSAAVDVCRASPGSDDCCRAHVVAEQTAIDLCGAYDSTLFGKLPTDVPGSKFCSDIVRASSPPPAFTGDFGKVKDRITYGYLRCCTGLF
jgi:hypothetical protein